VIVAVSEEEKEFRKRAIFESMSPRRKKHITKIGYDKWDPFEEPKDPIDIRRDKTNRTTQQLVREFLQNCPHEHYGNAYAGGVLELALGIINNEDRYIGMYEFSVWYQEHLKKAGL
jgi:hypothetical protein